MSDFYWTYPNTIKRKSDPTFSLRLKDIDQGTIVMDTFRELEKLEALHERD
jgi:hypothetical protein